MKNIIGLDQIKAAQLVEKLNDLIANYQLYYQNLRGFHWNIKGPQFFELHVKFETLYTAANLSIDEIAERILTLGGTPLHTYSSYLAKSEIEEQSNFTTASVTVKAVLDNLSVLISREREIMNLAAEAGDDGTATLIGDYITAQEKEIWMLAAYQS